MAATSAIGRSVEAIVQDLQDLLSQQAGTLKKITTKIDRMDARLSTFDERVAALEGRVSTAEVSSEISQAEAFFNQGQRLIEKSLYPDAVDVLKRALAEESDDCPLKGKIFFALFTTLVSLKRNSEILPYKEALLEVFKNAQGPDEARIKAAIIMYKQERPQDCLEKVFVEKEKFDEYKGLLLYHSAKRMAQEPFSGLTFIGSSWTYDHLREECHKCLRHNNLTLKMQIRCKSFLLAIYYKHSSSVLARRDVLDEREKLAREILDLLDNPELSTWKHKTVLTAQIEEALSDISSIRQEKASQPSASAAAAPKKRGWLNW